MTDKIWGSTNLTASGVVTYDDIQQEFYNDIPLELKPVCRDKNKNLTTEFDILKKVIHQITIALTGDLLDGKNVDIEERLSTICKISIAYNFADDVDIYDEGFDFITRTNSMYYFQPDQRDMLEQMVTEATGIASRTRTHAESFPNAVTK